MKKKKEQAIPWRQNYIWLSLKFVQALTTFINEDISLVSWRLSSRDMNKGGKRSTGSDFIQKVISLYEPFTGRKDGQEVSTWNDEVYSQCGPDNSLYQRFSSLMAVVCTCVSSLAHFTCRQIARVSRSLARPDEIMFRKQSDGWQLRLLLVVINFLFIWLREVTSTAWKVNLRARRSGAKEKRERERERE